MPSFQELQHQLVDAQRRLAVLKYLTEHLDTEFKNSGEDAPKMRLLGDDKLPIPVEAFEDVISEVLVPAAEEAETTISQVMNSTLEGATP